MKILVEFEFMYLKAQRSGNMSDTVTRGRSHRGVYSIVRRIECNVCTTCLSTKYQSSIEHVQYMDTNFWCKIAQ